VHDERIGVGQVYHLFRLPEDMEQQIHRILHDQEVISRIQQALRGRDEALAFLRQGTDSERTGDVGPLLVADPTKIRTPDTWQLVATKYAGGFENGTEVFPYFANGK
jgi:hypothetical protein